MEQSKAEHDNHGIMVYRRITLLTYSGASREKIECYDHATPGAGDASCARRTVPARRDLIV